eukprot:1629499-Rhodomonas_salina.2
MMQPLDQTENLEAETTDQVPESGDRVVPFLILVSIMMNVLPSFVSRRRGVAWAVLQRGLEQGRDRQLPLILHLRLRLRRRLHLRLRRRVHHEQVRVLRLQCFDLRLHTTHPVRPRQHFLKSRGPRTAKSTSKSASSASHSASAGLGKGYQACARDSARHTRGTRSPALRQRQTSWDDGAEGARRIP